MRRVGTQRTIQRLLSTSRDLIANHGAGKLTMERVVEHAQMSKGALVYHFKSMDGLAARLMQDAIEEFDNFVRELRGDDRSPGSFTRAYIRVATGRGPRRSYAATYEVIAELSHFPKLRQVYFGAARRWSREIEGDGLDPTIAQLLRLGADGLWWNESAGARPLRPTQRSRFVNCMLQWASSAGVVVAVDGRALTRQAASKAFQPPAPIRARSAALAKRAGAK